MQVQPFPPDPANNKFFDRIDAAPLPRALKFTKGDLVQVAYETRLWICTARNAGIDVSNYSNRIQSIIKNGLEIRRNSTRLGANQLVYQIIARRKICDQIRKHVLWSHIVKRFVEHFLNPQQNLSEQRSAIPPAPPISDKLIEELNAIKPKLKVRRLHHSHDLVCIPIDTRKWMKIARDEGVDVTKELRKIHWTVMDGLYIRQKIGRMTEVQLARQIITRSMFCCQIIRKVVRQRIEHFASSLTRMPELRHKLNLIAQCKKSQMSKLPHKIFLQPLNVMEDYCRAVTNNLETMKQKILKEAKIKTIKQ